MKTLLIILSFSIFTNLKVEAKIKPIAEVKKAPVNVKVFSNEQIEAFSKKELTLKNNLAETVDVVEYLLSIDDTQPSRMHAIDLSESYNANKKVYKKAFSIVEKNKSKHQKKNLKELQKLMAEVMFRNGNG